PQTRSMSSSMNYDTLLFGHPSRHLRGELRTPPAGVPAGLGVRGLFRDARPLGLGQPPVGHSRSELLPDPRSESATTGSTSTREAVPTTGGSHGDERNRGGSLGPGPVAAGQPRLLFADRTAPAGRLQRRRPQRPVVPHRVHSPRGHLAAVPLPAAAN